MSLGAILTSTAALVLVAAYVARPFRRVHVDADRAIDGWVRKLHAAAVAVDEVSEPAGVDAEIAAPEVDPEVALLSTNAAPVLTGATEPATVAVTATDQDEPVNFCPYCGRRVEPDHVFCPKCGRQLSEGDA